MHTVCMCTYNPLCIFSTNMKSVFHHMSSVQILCCPCMLVGEQDFPAHGLWSSAIYSVSMYWIVITNQPAFINYIISISVRTPSYCWWLTHVKTWYKPFKYLLNSHHFTNKKLWMVATMKGFPWDSYETHGITSTFILGGFQRDSTNQQDFSDLPGQLCISCKATAALMVKFPIVLTMFKLVNFMIIYEVQLTLLTLSHNPSKSVSTLQ